LVVAVRIWYRALLLAYPGDFRRRDGEAAVALFESVCRDAWHRGGLRAVIGRLVHALVEVPRVGLADRRAGQSRARGSSPLPDLFLDVRHSVRSLARRPSLSLAIVLALGVGIGANTAIFSVIDDTLLRPLPFRHADRVVFVRARAIEGDARRDPTVEQLRQWEAASGIFERLEARRTERVVLDLEDGAPPRRLTVLRVTPGFLAALPIRPLSGRFLTADDGGADAVPVTVLTERFWMQRLAGDPEIVGRAITLDGVDHTVVGVAPDVMMDQPTSDPDVYAALPTEGLAARSTPARGIGWLMDGLTLEAARPRLEAVSATADEAGDRVIGTLERNRNIFWLADTYRVVLFSLMGAVCLVLAVACGNVANLMLAAGAARRGELAVRSALGAGRLRIARLLLTESLLLTVAGGAVGLLLAWAGIQLITSLDPGSAQLRNRLATVRLDGLVLGYAIVIATLTGLAAGLVPALRASVSAPGAALQQADRRVGGGRGGLRRAFVVVQMALSVTLLLVAGLAVRAYVQMTVSDPGYEPDPVLTARIELEETSYPDPAQRTAFFEALTAAAARLPGVIGVSLGYASVPPEAFLVRGPVTVEGGDPEGSRELMFHGSRVDASYFEVMGMPLLAGRSFLPAEIQDVDVAAEIPVVVSRSWADRFLLDAGSVGTQLRIGDSPDGRWHRVVGIVGDTNIQGLLAGPGHPELAWHVYFPLDPARFHRTTDLLLRLAEGAPPPIGGLRAAVRRLDPRLPLDTPETAATALYDWLAEPRFSAVLFAAFAGIALILATLGIFGVVSNDVRQRTREMGIRLAVGAGPRQVVRLVLRQGMAPVLAGILLGSLAAVVVLRATARLYYDIGPFDPLTFAAATGVLLLVAILAIWLPARRTARVDPVSALNL
jgi:predicted permease